MNREQYEKLALESVNMAIESIYGPPAEIHLLRAQVYATLAVAMSTRREVVNLGDG